MTIFAYKLKSNYMLKAVILFFGMLLNPVETDEMIAIDYYKELGTTCVPNNLREGRYEYEYINTTYIMQKDYNYIP
jgi:hypothetical protein